MREPPSPRLLFELQTWFAKHITAPIEATDSTHIPLFLPEEIGEIRKRIAPSPYLKSEERLGIYQQQYWWRLITICQEIYPTLVCLFDYEDFNRLIAVPYLLKHPPNDWFLSRLGSKLPTWIKKSYKGKDTPLVFGVALLDLAYEDLLFTDILPPIELSQYETKKLYLQPYVKLFQFSVDLFTFRKKLLEHPPSHWGNSDLPLLENNGQKIHFVLFRKGEQSIFEEISPELFSLLDRFRKGAKLTDLIPLLQTCKGLLESFQLIGSRGWLTSSKSNH